SSVFRLADFVVAVTPHAREILKKRFGRTEDIFVIPNACDEEFFAAHRERGPQAVIRRFVFVGRVADQQKGLSTLCAALAVLKREGRDFSMDIIGDGPDMARTRSQVGLLGLGENLRFLGWRDVGELARLLPGYDLCILPSNFEACSLAVIECMAVGIPLVTTKVGGTPWLVKSKKHGLLVPHRDPVALAEVIKWACDHPAEMALMARWARKKALKRYHWDRAIKDYAALLAKVHTANCGRKEARPELRARRA
ncbi:MAG: glycosyltransferase family 4 protein, partial [Candidatus Brocadiae bacterium]|nr:glycosyltransferase family 4 protein [Candidatus Brocadiia bacterium]